MLNPPTLTPFRARLLSLIPPDRDHLAASPMTAFVWPTEDCSIGCAHCNFSSKPRRHGSPSDLRHDPQTLYTWLSDAGTRRLVLCGGGEPLDEPDFCAEVVRMCGQGNIDFGIYTSGTSLATPDTPEHYIRRWRDLRGDRHGGRFHVRLSMDAFHTARLGVDVLADWIRTVERLAPEWRVSLRSLKVLGDTSLAQLADKLSATVREPGHGAARLVLPSGRVLAVERMGYIMEGRGTLDLLNRYGLHLPPEPAASAALWQELVGRGNWLGRPLSRRLPVGARHLDLEIHADTKVHVLEAQAFDARLSLEDHSWSAMRDLYYRDPIIHAVGIHGLELVATLLRAAIERGVAPRSTVPFSVEYISDAGVLDWVTAAAVQELADVVDYPAAAMELAREVCADWPAKQPQARIGER
jgi:hypothetical protein